MRTSEQINEIATALAKAQGEMKNPEKNKKARIPTKAGGIYEYNYADLPSTFDCVREALAKNGLSHTSTTEDTVDGTFLFMRLIHSSGQWYEASKLLPEQVDPKQVAASLTYFRRYLFNGLIGISGDDDTDDVPETPNSQYGNRDLSFVANKTKPVTMPQLKRLTAIAASRQWQNKEVSQLIIELFKKGSSKDLLMGEYEELVEFIQKNPPEALDELLRNKQEPKT